VGCRELQQQQQVRPSTTDCEQLGPDGGTCSRLASRPSKAAVEAQIAVLTVGWCGFSTIGAGDTFIAAMLYGLHADAWSRETKLAFGVGLATKKVQTEGFAGLVT
jgi:hypothetical protein